MRNRNKLAFIMMCFFIMIGAIWGAMAWENENDVFLHTKTKLMVNGEEIDEQGEPYIDDKEIYLPYEVIKAYLYADLMLDEAYNRVLIPLGKSPVSLEDEILTDFIKENRITINVPFKEIGGIPYVSASLLDKILGIKIRYEESDQTVIVDTHKDTPTVLNQKREPFRIQNEKINIVWEYVHEKSPDLSKEDKKEALDVIVPTWFHIVDHEGTVVNNGDRKYVKDAHQKGYKVWGLVSNSFDPDLTSAILNDPQIRKKIIGQLVTYASLYDLDGINIDFENMHYEDKEKLVKFVEEMKHYIKRQNLVLSIDITVPSSSEKWSKVYDRKALGKLVDYVAVMAYDEHWASSPVSGSVASIGWVERGIVNSLEWIPEEKILLGLPFYTRQWKEYLDEDGKLKVESKAISMGKAQEIIDSQNAEILWNEEMGQYYAQYKEADAVYKIWMEDPRSIARKVSLVEKYNLRGTAGWRKGFEDEEVWAVLKEIIKDGRKYTELVFKDKKKSI
ncbi:glycosyl hydrolase family 18 protein [Clostridiaceae bacterium 35-E11]